MTNSKKQVSARFLGKTRTEKSKEVATITQEGCSQAIFLRHSTNVDTKNWSNAIKAIHLAIEDITEGFEYTLKSATKLKDEVHFATAYGFVSCESFNVQGGIELIVHSVNTEDVEISFEEEEFNFQIEEEFQSITV